MVYALSAATAAILFWYGTGLHPAWQFLWVAPLPVLLAARYVSARKAFALAWIAYFAGTMNMWSYYREVAVPLPVIALIGIVPSALFAASALYWRRAEAQGRHLLAAFSLPVFWAAGETINVALSAHGTFGVLAYSQMNALPVIQLASITGWCGISFLVLLPAAAVATKRKAPMLAAFAIVALAWAWGVQRIAHTPAAPIAKTGLASSDRFPAHPPDTQRLASLYAAEASRLAASGAELIVIPEKLAKATTEETVRAFDDPLRATGVDLAAGLERWTPEARRNEIRFYPRTGPTLLYEKHHMLPAFESHLLVGTERVTVERPSGKWGMAICKDMDFPTLSREYGRDGVGLMIVPAWDFVNDGWLHSRMAILRGVESGFTIVRAAKQGSLTVSDDRGRVLAEQVTGAAPLASLLAAAPVRHTSTIYARTGDWFGWLNVAAALILLAQIVWPRRRPAQASA